MQQAQDIFIGPPEPYPVIEESYSSKEMTALKYISQIGEFFDVNTNDMDVFSVFRDKSYSLGHRIITDKKDINQRLMEHVQNKLAPPSEITLNPMLVENL